MQQGKIRFLECFLYPIVCRTHPMAADYEHLLEAFRVKTGTAGLSIEVKQQKQSLNDIEGFLESDPFDRVSIAQGAKFTAKATVRISLHMIIIKNIACMVHCDFRCKKMLKLSAVTIYI